MTDEIVEPIVSEVETVVSSVEESVEPVKAVSKHEEAALAKGWRPKSEFVGDPDEFRGAKEWLERGEILDTVHSLKRQIKEQSESLQHMAEFSKKIETVTRERTLAELEAKHRAAVEVGDIEGAALAAKDMIKASTESIRPVAPSQAQPGIDPEVHAFVARNTGWFNDNSAENSAMKSFAIKRDAEIVAENPGITPVEVMRRLESDVKKFFPHKFVTAPVSAVSASSIAPTKTKEAAIPEYHRKMMDKLSRTVKGFDKAGYIKMCKDLGEF